MPGNHEIQVPRGVMTRHDYHLEPDGTIRICTKPAARCAKGIHSHDRHELDLINEARTAAQTNGPLPLTSALLAVRDGMLHWLDHHYDPTSDHYAPISARAYQAHLVHMVGTCGYTWQTAPPDTSQMAGRYWADPRDGRHLILGDPNGGVKALPAVLPGACRTPGWFTPQRQATWLTLTEHPDHVLTDGVTVGAVVAYVIAVSHMSAVTGRAYRTLGARVDAPERLRALTDSIDDGGLAGWWAWMDRLAGLLGATIQPGVGGARPVSGPGQIAVPYPAGGLVFARIHPV